MTDPDLTLDALIARLHLCDDQDAEDELGRSELSTLLHRHHRHVLDRLLRLAKKDPALQRCLAAARWYSGLPEPVCERIDALMANPFGTPRRQPR